MRVFKAPETRGADEQLPLKIFLAGSISGKHGLGGDLAEDWQTRITNMLEPYNVEIFNPRRESWDSSWEQNPTRGTQFREQVDWELEHMTDADLVLFYFDPETKSPITMMELGLTIGKQKNILVYCPQEFYRYGNVAVIMSHFGKEDNLYINESDWASELMLMLEMYKAMAVVDDVVAGNVNEETTVIDNPIEIESRISPTNIRIVSEMVNPELEQYIMEKYKLKENKE